jgi:hypothetical protein
MGLSETLDWKRGWADHPELALGWKTLLRMRTGSFLTSPRLFHIAGPEGGFSASSRVECPFCDLGKKETVTHLLMECAAWDHQRMYFFGDVLTRMYQSNPEKYDEDTLASLLLGQKAAVEDAAATMQIAWCPAPLLMGIRQGDVDDDWVQEPQIRPQHDDHRNTMVDVEEAGVENDTAEVNSMREVDRDSEVEAEGYGNEDAAPADMVHDSDADTVVVEDVDELSTEVETEAEETSAEEDIEVASVVSEEGSEAGVRNHTGGLHVPVKWNKKEPICVLVARFLQEIIPLRARKINHIRRDFAV